jgi:hypothetical protein
VTIMVTHRLLEWDTVQTGILVPMRKLLLPPTGEKGARGGAVVEALRYKLDGCGIDSRWCQNFSLT